MPTPRELELQDLEGSSSLPLLIIGGGIHGAALARIAALNGVSCILAEAADYAAGTSSRSSKMAHGGLRYLENFDFEQVFEGIKAREEMFNDAPHMVRPERFLIPVKAGDWWFRLKLGVGLYLYDLMVTKKERKHRFIPRSKLSFEGFHKERADLMGCYQYTDGLMNDSRLVIESIVAARAMGAKCFNYMKVSAVEDLTTDPNATKSKVTLIDQLSGQNYEVIADVVVNCTGPWAPFIGHKPSEPLKDELRYSAGIHLIFNRPWTDPSLFLPMPGKSRYYFVWPHPGGTMVGTTERQVTDVPLEQYPTEAEVNEVLERLKTDLPHAGLTRETLHYSFAGVRTLPVRDKSAKGTATLSRKHIWKWQGNVLTLLGGKYTTASWTAFEGFKVAASRLGLNGNLKSLSGVPYPGAGTSDELQKIERDLVAGGVSAATAKRIVTRLGIRARYLLEKPGRLNPVSPNLLHGEIELAVNEEQAVTPEDVLRRRTELEYMPGLGLYELSAVVETLKEIRDGKEVQREADSYRNRMENLTRVMGRELSRF